MELAFAGLHQLCAPMLDRLARLPGTAARRAADGVRPEYGGAAGSVPGRAGGAQPAGRGGRGAAAVCVVDDAQWLDRVSAQTLAFVARRLLAERVALVFAVREPSDGVELAGLPELVVARACVNGDARALLDSVIVGPVDERVRDRIVAETRGNPLALLELPRGLTPAELAGGFGLPDALPLAGRIERGFLRRLEPLPVDTRRLLLTAAAEPVGDATLLWRAAERLGIGADAAAPAEAAGLIELGARGAVPPSAGALGGVPRGERAATGRRCIARWPRRPTRSADPERRAWHRAHAAVGPDEVVAGELEDLAGRAQARGGIAAAAAFLARAAELTPDPARRGARALAAAQAKFDAGAPAAAFELLATADSPRSTSSSAPALARLRAQIAFARTRGSDAPPLLLAAAQRLEPLDAGLARETYLEALARGASSPAGSTVAEDVRAVAAAARAAPRQPGAAAGRSTCCSTAWRRGTPTGYAAGLAPLRRRAGRVRARTTARPTGPALAVTGVPRRP